MKIHTIVHLKLDKDLKKYYTFYNMYNFFSIVIFFIISPLQVYSRVNCWCQKGPSTYQTLLDNEYSLSSYTNCYLTGNNPSSNTCYDTTCPGGDWVKGSSYVSDEVVIVAIDGDDCISKCLQLNKMDQRYNIANMMANCGNTDDDNTAGSCNTLTCPNIWDGHCGVFSNPTDKWCDYDRSGGPGHNNNVCCAADFSECCESDDVVIGCTISAVVVFIVFCVWYCTRRRDNTNDEIPNIFYRFCCPTCAVLDYQGCESKTDVCMACCVGNLFTLFCWQPKRICVTDEQNNKTILDKKVIELQKVKEKSQLV